MLVMYDSVTIDQLPPGAPAYAGYVDGAYANVTEIRAQHPAAHILTIAVFPEHDADCLDVETGDATPADTPAWVQRQLARGVNRPVIYCSASIVAEVLDILAADGISRPQIRLWSAHYDAGQHICGPSTCAYTVPGGQVITACDGTQWTDTALGRNLDESILADTFFDATADPEEHDMILVTVDKASVPTGTTWPGDFLLFSDGTLGHITPASKTVNNVTSYQAAGIKGPVTITYSEYLARGGTRT